MYLAFGILPDLCLLSPFCSCPQTSAVLYHAHLQRFTGLRAMNHVYVPHFPNQVSESLYF